MIYTQKAEQALKLAKRASARLKHPYIGTEHILIGLLEEETGAAGQVLAGAGVTVEALTDMISQLIAPESGSLMEPGRAGVYPKGQEDPGGCSRGSEAFS